MYHMLTHFYAWSKYAWWALPLTAGPLVAILMGLYPECLYAYVMVTSTEMMPSHHVIRIVNANYQAQKETYLSQLTKTMKRELTRMRVREAAKAGRLHEIEDLFDQLPPQSQSHYLHCFEAFDLKSKGGLDRGELVACLQEIEPDSPVSVEDGDGKKAGQYTDREAEDWFRILGYANTGIMARQGFKCLVASLSGSADQLLEEEDALGLLLSHGGSVTLKADDRVLRMDQVESVLKSVCPVVPLFQSAGSELVRDMTRNVDTSADAVLGLPGGDARPRERGARARGGADGHRQPQQPREAADASVHAHARELPVAHGRAAPVRRRAPPEAQLAAALQPVPDAEGRPRARGK